MVRGILDWFTALFSSDQHDDSEEAKGSRFLPSVLDASVRYIHGQNNSSGERQITIGLFISALSATVLISTVWIVVGPQAGILFGIFGIAFPVLMGSIFGRRTPYS